MTTTTEARPIAEIEAELAEATRKVLAVAADLKAGQENCERLQAERRAVWATADAALPKAFVCNNRSDKRTEVVVTRRTKSRVFTRYPGTDPKSPELQWKQSKFSPGRWEKIPAEKWNFTFLELPQEAKA